jgi:hypothetical protein
MSATTMRAGAFTSCGAVAFRPSARWPFRPARGRRPKAVPGVTKADDPLVGCRAGPIAAGAMPAVPDRRRWSLDRRVGRDFAAHLPDLPHPHRIFFAALFRWLAPRQPLCRGVYNGPADWTGPAWHRRAAGARLQLGQSSGFSRALYLRSGRGSLAARRADRRSNCSMDHKVAIFS